MTINVEGVMAEIATELSDALPGVPVYDHPPSKITKTPALIVTYPSEITYNAAGESGLDRMVVGIIVVMAEKVTRVTHAQLGGFASGDGPTSVRRILEDKDTWTLIEGVSVQSGEFDVFAFGATEYLAVVITAEILG